MTSLPLNMNCVHKNMCETLGERGGCPEKCREYIHDENVDHFFQDAVAYQRWGMPIPYDCNIGYSNVGRPAERGFKVVLRNGGFGLCK